MAQVLDSPVSSPISSPIASRRVVDFGVSLGGRSRQGRSPSASPAKEDPFAFHDSDAEEEEKKNKSNSAGATGECRSSQTSTSNHHQQQQRLSDMNNLLMDTTSQHSFVSHGTGHASEPLTQNAMDFTQMTQDGNDTNLSLSPFPTNTPAKPQPLPWSRLMPCHGGVAVDLMPRAPEEEDDPKTMGTAATGPQSFSIVGLDNLRPSDIFNVYTLGRSLKCDIVAPKAEKDSNQTEKEQKLLEWAYGLVSNRHARIYCSLPEVPRTAAANNKATGSTTLPASQMEVWIEDTSNNGTWINQTIHLKRGQKRRLHSGDEISLVSREMLQKRIRDNARLQAVIQRYSFVFVNVAHQHFKPQQQRGGGMKVMKQQVQPSPQKPPIVMMSSTGSPIHIPAPNTGSSGKRRAGLVNPRAMNYHHPPGSSRSPKPTPVGGQQLRSPAPNTGVTPKSGNMGHTTPVPLGSGNRRTPFDPSTVAAGSSNPASPKRIEQDYDIRDLLGRGTCGEVRRAIHRQTGKSFAVKIISLPAPSLMERKVKEEAQQWEAEARILQSLEHHPYIVRLADIFRTDTHLYLIMDLCEGGDLFDRITTTGYSETESRRVMRRLLSAMHYLHEECSISHRDLKPENILLVGSDPWDIRIGDFGTAKTGNEMKTFCGTPLYFAPEVLERRHTVFAKGSYGKSADMWSVGVILYILLSGTPPYNIDGAAGMDVILQSSLKISFPRKYWSSISSGAQDLVRKLMCRDPNQRLTVRDAVSHPWLLIDDGDTHRHPLEDPRLISVTKKRLFTTGSPPPASFTASTSSPKQPNRKRRKVSMESAVDGSGPCSSEDFSLKEAHEKKTASTSNPQRPLSPVENILDSGISSPCASPSTAGSKLMAPMHGLNDENGIGVELDPDMVTSKKTEETGNVSKKATNTESTSTAQKLSSKLVDSLKAKILLAGNGEDEDSILHTRKKAKEGDIPNNEGGTMHPTDDDLCKETEDEEEDMKVVSPHSAATASRPDSSAEKVREGQEKTKTSFHGIDRPSHWNVAAGTGGKSSGEVDDDDDASYSEPPKPKPRSKSKKSNMQMQGLVKAAELPEDQICSQFSDEEEVLEEAETKSKSTQESTLSFSSDGTSKKGSQKKSTAKAPSPAKKKATKAKATVATKAKTGGGAGKKAVTNKSKKGKDDKQATLNRWFQPVKK